MWKSLERGSSPVDWCEGNYHFYPGIAEFANTVSNFLFFLLPPMLMHLFRDYGRFINSGIHVLWALLIVVGLSSVYFHATLSLAGQLLDEVAILWLFAAAFAMFFPRRCFPTSFKNDRFVNYLYRKIVNIIFRRKLRLWVMGSTVLLTYFSILQPAINAFALMTLAIPCLIVLGQELKRVKDPRVHRLGYRCALLWTLSVTCWINDRLFCDAWSAIDFPYLHAVWHVLIFLSAYTGLVLYAYFAVQDERPELRPVLRYWPQDDFELGIPFVAIRCYEARVDDPI